MTELPGKRIGPYQVLEQIGRGGMAAVYRARDASTGRFVALKLVAPHLAEDPNFEHRFLREARVLRKLEHPNIIPVLDYGEGNGYSFLVMPFLQVGSLTDRLRAGPLGPYEGSRLMNQISAALQYAHEQGVIHRDVKPSNVLLDEQGNAMLSDFGLARLLEPSASLTGSMLVGTPAYISPEQARGEKATDRSDQYSLGVILFELTTGELPFEAETPIAVALKHINEPLPAARQASPNVPELVERVILKATAKDPRQRFPSVAAMNRAFQEALHHSLDPDSTPAPRIELPAPVQSTMPLPRLEARSGRLRRNLTRAAGLALAIFLVVPAFTLARVMGVAPGMERSLGDLSPIQMAQLNGTLQAMSTELAGSQTDLMPAEQIQTAVAATLLAAAGEDGPTLQPSQTATPSVAPTRLGQTPSAAIRLTPIATAAASVSPTPQPSLLPMSLPSNTPQPTATPVTPAPSPTAGSTSTPTPSRTPTPTPTQDPCSALSLGGFGVSGKTASWLLTNGGTADRLITRLFLDWPATPNSELRKIRLGNSIIWNAGDTSPSTEVQSNWKGTPEVSAGTTQLKFEFVANADSDPQSYGIEVELDGTCQLGGGG